MATERSMGLNKMKYLTKLLAIGTLFLAGCAHNGNYFRGYEIEPKARIILEKYARERVAEFNREFAEVKTMQTDLLQQIEIICRGADADRNKSVTEVEALRYGK